MVQRGDESRQGQGKTGHDMISQAKPGQAKPSQAKASQAKTLPLSFAPFPFKSTAAFFTFCTHSIRLIDQAIAQDQKHKHKQKHRTRYLFPNECVHHHACYMGVYSRA
jgi:hypothetical protein